MTYLTYQDYQAAIEHAQHIYTHCPTCNIPLLLIPPEEWKTEWISPTGQIMEGPTTNGDHELLITHTTCPHCNLFHIRIEPFPTWQKSQVERAKKRLKKIRETKKIHAEKVKLELEKIKRQYAELTAINNAEIQENQQIIQAGKKLGIK
jgi:hypothetical protein